MSLRFRLYLSFLAVLLFGPSPAHADPISVIVLGVLGTSTATALAIAVTTFVLTAVAGLALSLLTNALFGPKNRQAERQASVLQLNIGEVPREVVFGKTATGGSLNDAGNYGGTYGTDWELLIITVADHKCASLEGFYVNDSYVAFTGDGDVSGYNGQLKVYWRDGSASQTLPSIVTNIGWSASEDVGGSALIVVAYKADAPDQSSTVFNARPSFLWVVKGKLCYDPRKDSTVGGSGAHRWATPSTWEWTDNLSVCRYNWVRGIYAKDQVTNPAMLLVGRGLTSIEAPESNVFAYANVCDETIALAAGGSVKRYTFNGVIRADEKYVDTERKFAECCAGIIVQPGGAVEVEPGQARSITATITDDDLVSGEDVQWSPFRSAADSAWVNTVVATYAEPEQKYQDHAAPVRRYAPDLTADGGPREQRLSLSSGVTNANQASRDAEIVRRMGRFVGSASITLPPRLAGITEGDWIQWTSARRFGGLTKTFRVEAYGLNEMWRNRLSLREIAASCFTWTTGDETASTAVAVPQTPPPGGWIRGYDQVDFATQVIGPGTPELYSTSADSMIVNGSVSVNSNGWAIGSGASHQLTGSAGDPSVGRFFFPASTANNFAIANDNTKRSIDGATALFVSGYSYMDVGGVSGVFQVSVDWYNAVGTFISSSLVSAIQSTLGAWLPFYGKVDAPASAASFVASFQRANASGVVFATSLRIAKTQPAADVTALAQVVVASPTLAEVACDYLGIPAFAELPRTLSVKVSRGGTSIKLDTTTTYAATFTNLTASIDNTGGSGTKGDVVITAMSANEGYVDVVVTVAGVAQPSVRTVVKKLLAPPPSPGGSGSKSATDTSLTALSATTDTQISDVLTVTLASGERLVGTGSIDYYVSGSTSAFRNVLVKWGYRVAGSGGSFTDFVASTYVTGTNGRSGRYVDGEWFEAEPGHVDANQDKSGLGAGDYECALFGKVNTSGRTLTFDGLARIEAKV